MNRLKLLRKERGLLQKEIANFLQIAISTYSYWENGTYDIDNESLQKLADFYNVSVDYLLGRPEKNSQEKQESKQEQIQDLKNIYFHLGKEVQEMGLDERDVEKILDFARYHYERNHKGKEDNESKK